MKVAWVFPVDKRCGISLYGHAYARALKALCNVQKVDPWEFVRSPTTAIDALNRVDVVHMQYETSLFMEHERDFYAQLCRGITRPIVVSLHEVYDDEPGIFPRRLIRGHGLAKWARQWLYDRRHPAATALRRHRASAFHARALCVHAASHLRTLSSQGVPETLIHIIPHPVQKPAVTAALPRLIKGEPLRLAMTGFVSPAYDYDTLFDALRLLDMPWRFTWIGGVRRTEDQPLLDALTARVASMKWSERVCFTGWVPDIERDRLLGDAHICCALCRHRSSSGSLATVLGAGRPIVASAIASILELQSSPPLMLAVDPTPRAIADALTHLAHNESARLSLSAAAVDYADAHSFDASARLLLPLYEKAVSP